MAFKADDPNLESYPRIFGKIPVKVVKSAFYQFEFKWRYNFASWMSHGCDGESFNNNKV